MVSPTLFNQQDLVLVATSLLDRSGMRSDAASTTAELLVEADMIGHDTHGLQLLPSYIAALSDGGMVGQGDPEVLNDTPVVSLWDGGYRPGLWLTDRALSLAATRARTFGVGVVTIRRSGHIGCLAAFLPRITAMGLVPLIASSDPCGGYVAPHGGKAPIFSPNPIAIGIPTAGDPILVDTSASTTTVGMSRRKAAAGERYSDPWFVAADGELTNDPSVMLASPAGAILPTGGASHGHKGFALAVMIEALTQGLAGFGRAEHPTTLGASVFVQVFDPVAFGGLESFIAQSTWLADACRGSPPAEGSRLVRMPGDQAHARRRIAKTRGVPLRSDLVRSLEMACSTLGLEWPATISSLEELA